MRTGQTDGQEDGQTDIGPKVRQYPTAWIGQGSTLGYIFSSYFNNLRGHHFWVIFRILTILWSWKIQHISIPHVNLLGLWMKSVNSLVPGRHKNSKYNCEVQIRPEMLTCDSTENCSLYNQGWPCMQWPGTLSRVPPVGKGCCRVSKVSTRGKVVTSLGQPQAAYQPREAVNLR